MTSLTSDDVRHIAKLCRLNIEESQLDTFATEMSAILGFIDTLKEVDTKGVEPTPQPTGITDRFREDIITTEGIEPKDLLDCSGLPIIDNQIQTPSAHG
ncbi:Asp-tRNA(Asn)/Glu-tRNA(Gln) amidotransferase subunit GatC [Candidatus Peregrinibacteria bacterium]|jgi:aspartyl/glutamyl-tRNA(Asn/Gln) amidotransferase C subunit|nr:Asp-tRNA(Asn)/Glu-tRNA(Gln) amidotransferase subunit GatC [Candidatus Peregrinibacteria bacterium]MBT5468612.1 Asp-tRNA(Asn)/Glu-tRNA(Gln) amidotransferase subunit GatC [Candidatus Peregrinibacteria bacterium]